MKRLAFIAMVPVGLLAAWLAGREAPQEGSPVRLAASAAAPPHLGAAASVAAAAQTTRSTASAASAAPAALPAATASVVHIGSEGYGPHIDRAQAGTDPEAAWEAVRWLRDCASNEARRGNFEQVRNQGVAPEFMTQRMVELDAEARRCQTVTEAHRAMLPELATRAMHAGVPEAAAAYAGTVFAGDLTAEQRRAVLEAMRRDADSGHAASLLGAITANEAWGLEDTERLAYLYAYAHLPGEAGAQAMSQTLLRQGAIKFRANFTSEQFEAGKRQGEQILERLRARRGS